MSSKKSKKIRKQKSRLDIYIGQPNGSCIIIREEFLESMKGWKGYETKEDLFKILQTSVAHLAEFVIDVMVELAKQNLENLGVDDKTQVK